MGNFQLFGALLKAAGYRSAVSYMSTAKKQHIKLGHPWTAAEKVSKVSVYKGCRRRTRSRSRSKGGCSRSPCWTEIYELCRGGLGESTCLEIRHRHLVREALGAHGG